MYLEKAFDGTGWRPDTPLPAAKELGETSLMFLVHPTLENQHIEKTIDALEFLNGILKKRVNKRLECS